ncbi:MAG: AbrB/MazE/SpoVT family DNA-binding domain-containing protein [Actinomycetota bacterium]
MRNTGMYRKVDHLGRIVIPAEMRRSFAIKVGDFLDLSVEGERIVVGKRQDACVFCGATGDLKDFKGRMICAPCIGELSGGPEIHPWEPFSE